MSGLCGTTWTITAGADVATIAEVGAGLRSFTREGKDVTCRYGDEELPPKGCGTTLVPWPNRIRGGSYTFDGVEQQLALTEPDKGNAIHGLGRWARWELVEHAEDQLRLGLDIVPQKGYPFQIHAEIKYSFRGMNGLNVELSARNDGSTRAPFGAGSHPYLSTRGVSLDDVLFYVPANETFDVDDQQIPIRARPVRADEDFAVHTNRLGPRRFDQGFTGIEFVEETPEGDPDKGLYAMSIAYGEGFDTGLWFDEAFRFLQVYTVDEVTPGQPGIAIEPMTCAPDAFNSGDGLIVLDPGEEWSGSWGISPAEPLSLLGTRVPSAGRQHL